MLKWGAVEMWSQGLWKYCKH